MRKFKFICFLALAFLTVSCSWFAEEEKQVPPENVMIFVSDGFNNLNSWLRQDIADLKKGYIPQKNDRNILLLLAHHTEGSYSIKTSPHLIRLYMDNETVVCDTIKSLNKGDRLTTKETFREFMEYIRETFPVDNYGLTLSSHATGWLPSGYYANPQSFEPSYKGGMGVMARPSSLFRHTYPERDPSLPMTKSIMSEKIGDNLAEEMEIEDFADAIPMHLKYILFDACLMGCVEVAYALRNSADLIGFSQTEVMSDGFDYENLTSRLLCDEPNPQSVCEDFITMYESFSGSYRSASISLVKTEKIGELAGICREYFEKYREQIVAMDKNAPQCFGGTKMYFYDLQDILSKAGITEEETAALEEALGKCIVYKGTTGQYYSVTDDSTHKILSFCGLSMYLPSAGTAFLDSFYKSLDWNKDTNLITN